MKLRILFLAAATFMVLNPGAATKAQAESPACDACIDDVIDSCSLLTDPDQWTFCINFCLGDCVDRGVCPASVIGG